MDAFPFPNELIERILTFCHPCDVASFSASCHAAYSVVYNVSYQFIWRELFLSYPFDRPYNSSPDGGSSINWQEELIRRIKAEKIISDPKTSKEVRVEGFQVFLAVILNAPPFDRDVPHPSYDLEWVESVLGCSEFWGFYLPNDDDIIPSRLRSYIALLKELQAYSLDSCSRLQSRRNQSRLFVYDMQNYIGKRYWGPFDDGGSVDWYHMEHLVNVAAYNFLELPTSWRNIMPPAGLEATRRSSAPDITIPSHDWAGVEGRWRRYVCYLDYRDLFALNFSVFTGGHPDPSFFDNPRVREASRLLEVNLHLVEKEQLSQRALEAIQSEGPIPADLRWPVLYFAGLAKGTDGTNATVEGTVYMSLDGVPRWKFMNDYSDQGEWRQAADAAQIGNIASAMGIVGVWTTPYHDDGDPIGPFWMWKIENNSETYLMDFSA